MFLLYNGIVIVFTLDYKEFLVFYNNRLTSYKNLVLFKMANV